MLEVTLDQVCIAGVFAEGCTVAPAPNELDQRLDALIAAPPADETVKSEVRDLLRHGKYKPTGRGKPACEYLLKAARSGRFPRINNLVDINNWVSLQSQLPISLIDVDRAGTDRFLVRRGRPEERYVFNSAGQEIDLEDLLLVAAGETACANPVKDSMKTKLTDESKNVLAVLYAPPTQADRLAQATEQFVDGLRRWSGASAVRAL